MSQFKEFDLSLRRFTGINCEYRTDKTIQLPEALSYVKSRSIQKYLNGSDRQAAAKRENSVRKMTLREKLAKIFPGTRKSLVSDDRERQNLRKTSQEESAAEGNCSSRTAKMGCPPPPQSAEDEKLKKRLDLYVERVLDNNLEIAKTALTCLKDEIRSATVSTTSVPKPLKFLKDHYENLKEYFKSIDDSTWRRELADLMSILAMVYEEPTSRMCLKWRLESTFDIDSWGSQYVKRLVVEIKLEHEDTLNVDDNKLAECVSEAHIVLIAEAAAKFYMSHKAEPDACDVLVAVGQLDLLIHLTESHNCQVICKYLGSLASVLAFPKNVEMYCLCYKIVMKHGLLFNAMQYALKIDSKELVRKVIKSVNETHDCETKQQIIYLLGQKAFDIDGQSDSDESDSDDSPQAQTENGYTFAHQLHDITSLYPKNTKQTYI